MFKVLYPPTGKRFYFQDACLASVNPLILLTALGTDWKGGDGVTVQWRQTDEGLFSWIALPR